MNNARKRLGMLPNIGPGSPLHGDDFSPQQISEWYADEMEGYAQLGSGHRASYRYGYHALNALHGYRHLPDDFQAKSVLGFGSAYGDELLPIIQRIKDVTIVDASDAFVNTLIRGRRPLYSKADPSGLLPFAPGAFDLVTCLGVLHHIPNVSLVITELARVLRGGGYLLLREPIVSMGDWRKPRLGLTRRERGIPLPFLEEAFSRNCLRVRNRAFCMFPATSRLFKGSNGAFNSTSTTAVDALMSSMFSWNTRYHAVSFFQKLRPTSAYFVLQKETDE